MFDRRELLKLTGVAALGGVGTASTASRSRAQSSDEVLFSEDFTGVSTGSVPDDFTLAGNNSQQVSASTAVTGGQSYQMDGSYGGCWEAIARVPMDVRDEMTLTGYYRFENGELGCHENTKGHIGLHTTTGSSWSDGSGVRLLNFAPDGTVKANGQEVGTYADGEWVEFEVEYVHDSANGTVTYSCSINGSQAQSATRDARDFEAELSALRLVSGDFTVYWDDIRVEAGVGSAEPAAVELSVDSVTPQPADPAGSVTVTVTATNTGGQAATQPVDLSFDGSRLGRREVDLAPGASQTVEYTVTAPEEGGTYSYEVTTDGATAPAPIEVDEPSSRSAVDLSVGSVTPQEAAPGESVSIEVVASNNGTESRTATVDITLDAVGRESSEITVGAGNSTTVEFSATAPDETGDYLIEATSGAATANGTLTVSSAPAGQFELTELFPERIQAESGEAVPVTTTINNTGSTDRTETVSVLRNGTVVTEVELSLAAGEGIERDFWVTVPNAGGEYNYTVETGRNSRSWTADVEEVSNEFSITDVRAPSQVRAGESVTVVVEIESTGDSQQSVPVAIAAESDRFATTVFDDSVTLSGSGRTRVSESFAAPAVDRPTAVVFTVSAGEKRYESDEIVVEPQPQADDGASPPNDDGSGGDGGGGTDDSIEVTVPGFTVPGTVSSLGGAAYLLKRRLGDDSEGDQ